MIKSGTCKHFNGIQNEKCAMEINMRELTGGDSLGWAKRMPCFEKNGTKCDLYSEPTKEELEADEASTEKIIQEVMLVMPLVSKWKDKHKSGGAGEDICPVCKGKLNYSISSYNGHCHAKCETDNCIKLMQ